MRLSHFLLIFFSLLHSMEPYKILVYDPKFGHSHSNFQGRIADILLDAGHNVTMLISEVDAEVNGGTVKSSEIRVKQSEKTSYMMEEMKRMKTEMFSKNIFNPIGAVMMGRFIGKLFTTQCTSLLDEPGLIDRLRDEKYDVFITENFDMCGTALSHLIKPRSLISTSSSILLGQHFDEFGVPQPVSFTPTTPMSSFDVHSFLDRLWNLYSSFLERIMFYYTRVNIDKLFKQRYGQGFPSVQKISSHSAFVFINSEPLIDFATPTMNKVISIGGIGAKKPKPLDKDWEEVLNRRERTILLSFGSMMRSAYLEDNIKQSILKTVAAFPDVTFIWKYEEDDEFSVKEASKLNNLVLTKWMPQLDILNHKRLAAFITHGGMGSTMETSLAGVPGVFIPLFGDQPRNALMMEHNKLGKVLSKYDISDSTKLIAVVREVLENDRYHSNAKRISAMLRKKPFTSIEKVIKYTEFAAEFGPSSALRPQSHDMTFIEYYNIDIIVSIVLVTIVVCFISLKISLSIVKKFVTAKTKTD